MVAGLGGLLMLWSLRAGIKPVMALAAVAVVSLAVSIATEVTASTFSYFNEITNDVSSPWGRPVYWGLLLDLPSPGQRITGIGLDNLVLINPYHPPGTTAESATAHNLYLQVFLEMGVAGVLSGFLLIVAIGASLFARASTKRPDWWWRAVVAAAWISLLIHGLFDYLLPSTAGASSLVLLLGLAIALPIRLRESQETESKESKGGHLEYSQVR
jgi:O-antigen ligase